MGTKTLAQSMRYKNDGGESEVIELKKLLGDIAKKYEASVEFQRKQEAKNDNLEKALSAAETKLEKSEDATEIKTLKQKLEDLTNELSDVRTKAMNGFGQPQYDEETEKKAMKGIAGSAIKAFMGDAQGGDFFKFIQNNSADQVKALNITNPESAGLAIAEVLARDIIEYAREFSPVLGLVRTKSSMTRSYRQMVKVAYPKTRRGAENVAGTNPPNTDTQLYKQVKSHTFKISAEPRITQEAMAAPDIDVYADLVSDMGTEIAVALADDVWNGDGSDNVARGIIGVRLDITDVTGESWKPSLAADPADARDADVYPAYSTGVSGDLGIDDETRVNAIIDIVNSLPTMFLKGAYWVMNRNTKGMLEKIRNANKDPIFRSDFRDGKFVLNGYPVYIDDTLPDMAADAPFMLFGNLGLAYAINSGDIDQMLFNPYISRGNVVVEYDKEMFEMMQKSDAIRIIVATTNAGA